MTTGFRDYCSVKCATNSRDETKRQHIMCENNIKKYGVAHIFQSEIVKDKIRATNVERYGVPNPQQNKDIKSKTNLTNVERYGVPNPQQNKDIKSKTNLTNVTRYGGPAPTCSRAVIDRREHNNVEKYGVRHPSQLVSIKNKSKYTSLKQYGVDNYQKRNVTNIKLMTHDYIIDNFINDTGYILIEDVCKFFNISTTKFYRIKHELNITNPTYSTKHKTQQEIYDFISVKKILNDRLILNGKELDILLPDNNIAIEFNGLMYHSFGKSKYSMFDNYTDENKYLHYTKTRDCIDKNIQLLHIFENEWLNQTKRDIWKSVINSKLGIYEQKIFANECQIIDLKTDNNLVTTFLEQNHLQGFAKSSIKLGLLFDGKVVSIMTFSKSRYNEKYQYELVRFCNKINTMVIGSADKLFNYFIKLHDPNSIISFTNMRWSNGGVYDKLGFSKLSISLPNYYYFLPSNKILINSQTFQKHKLKNKLQIYDDELSGTLNMYNNGYRKIYDCGNIIYIWNSNH
jgi:hypothetical protein